MTEMTRSARARRLLGTPLCAVVAIALPTTGPLPAQEPTVRVHVEPAVAMVGEQIRLTIEVFGASEVGPFEVTADGRTLQTEPVTLLVTFPDPGAISVRARLDRTEVEVMEEFELIVDVTPADVVLAWRHLPDVTGVAATGGSSRRDGSIAFDLVATAPGTHEIGPVAFKVGDETLKTEPVSVVVVGDPPAMGRHPVAIGTRFVANTNSAPWPRANSKSDLCRSWSPVRRF